MNHTALIWFICATSVGSTISVLLVVIWSTPMIDGWSKLAARYRISQPVAGTEWRFQSIAMRCRATAKYGSCAKIVVNQDGLGLSLLWPLSVSHPPLFIPWSEIMVRPETMFAIFKRVRLSFPQEPRVTLFFGQPLAEKVQHAIGEDWFAASAEDQTATTQHPH